MKLTVTSPSEETVLPKTYSYVPVVEHYNIISLQKDNFNKLIEELVLREKSFRKNEDVDESYRVAADEADKMILLLLNYSLVYLDNHNNTVVTTCSSCCWRIVN